MTAGAMAAARTLVDKVGAELGRLMEAVEQARIDRLADVQAKEAALAEEVAAMDGVQHAQDSRMVLDVGGVQYHFIRCGSV